jgi:hypothetical protein
VTSAARTLKQGVAALRTRWRAAQVAAEGRNEGGKKATRAYGESVGYASVIVALNARSAQSAEDLRQFAASLHGEADAELKKARGVKRDAAKRRGNAHAMRICAESLERLALEALAS